ncbi:thioesterase family protein [Luteolibacter sp. SL250]|uniref:acyl-CoA thioesterase n=1 Tax=Luteolibacter sp. SL250 TaxID=2995170 RepID=UPI00227125DD|nr:thioesterase family protein [Luteolibacter sp. SL250]WAC19819.1 thioesterase family protein [Luteolibacter sp. SL250]
MENPRHRQTLEVAFGDTDASGWVHFPNIFRYVEIAEHAFLSSRGIIVFARDGGGWPRAGVSADFKRPLQLGDRIEVLLGISRVGGASVTWEFEVIGKDGELSASGSMTTVRVGSDGKPRILSDDERAKLEGGNI